MTTVGILGAGLSGVLMGMQLRRAGIDDFTIYERQPDVGGTWYRNTYPGLHCDVPSHLYCYSFEPNPDWSMTYAAQAEIQAYVRTCAEKYGLLEQTRLATVVESARWDDAESSWGLAIADGSDATHRVLVSATGGLTAPRLPSIPGIDRYTGLVWHSGAWRHDVDLTGLRVAVVGSAASAVQVVPEVAKVAREVVVYSRTPNWVVPRNNAAYTAEEQEALRDDLEWRRLRARQYRASMYLYGAFKKRPRAAAVLRRVALANLHSAIADPELRDVLTPRYEIGCKRVVVSDEYYPALAQDHVRLVPHGVTELTETAVIAADGSHDVVDALVFCTGYQLGGRESGRPAVEVFGRGGQRLIAALAARPEAYRGVAIPGFPNYFTICGINGVVAYASLFLSAEAHTEFITGWVRRMLEEGIASVEVRADAAARYNEAIQAELQQMSWAGDCPSFYRDATGRVLAFHPGTLGRFRRELRRAADDDFELQAAVTR